MIHLIITCIISLATGFVTSVSVIQPGKLQTFVPGQTVTLSCNIFDFNGNHFYWFRQSLGEGPTCIVNLFSGATSEFYGQFKNDKRLKTQKNGDMFTLTIDKTKPNDTGIYYCAVRDYDSFVFGSGVFLSNEDLKHQHYIKEVVSLEQTNENLKVTEQLQPKDNVTLQCTVAAESCAGEHSVFWIRSGSGESHPGIIYTDGGHSDQCKDRSDAGSSTQSCIYNLPKRNLKTSDAGTYYCAVATCGEILFGKGITIKLTGQKREYTKMQMAILGLAVLSGMCFIIIAVLLCALAKKSEVSTPEKRVPSHNPATSHESSSMSVEREDLSYAALKFPAKKFKRWETQRDQTVEYASHRDVNCFMV